jgi:hypothetical protein
MARYPVVVLSVTLSSLLLVACSGGHATPDGIGTEGPVQRPPNCDGSWRPGPLPTPGWVAGPPSSCQAPIPNDPEGAYSDCDLPDGGYDPTVCGVPGSQAIVCVGNVYSGVGRVSSTCRKAADCPEGMACVVDGNPVESVPPGSSYGYCEKRCDPSAGAADCIRCDLACSAGGVCQPSPVTPTGPACSHDCQCPGACVGGHCGASLSGRAGICGSDGDCACQGGDCRGQCCYLPDGGIATPGSTVCRPSP